MLRGAGQVMFQQSALSGALFIAALMSGAHLMGRPSVALGAALGLIASTLVSALSRRDDAGVDQGLHGFNGLLVGAGVMTFLAPSAHTWGLVVALGALSEVVGHALARILRGTGAPGLTFPFVLTTWCAVGAATSLSALRPAAPAVAPYGALAFDGYMGWMGDVILLGNAQVFLLDSRVAGVLVIAALLAGSPRAAAWAIVGATLGAGVALLLGAPPGAVRAGLWGFSPALTAVALGATFLEPTVRGAATTLAAIAATVFVQAALARALTPMDLPVLTAPFVLTTWLFLLARREGSRS